MTHSSKTLTSDAIDGKVLMEGYKARGVILTKIETDLAKNRKNSNLSAFLEMFEE